MEVTSSLTLLLLVAPVALAVGPSLQEAPGVQQLVGNFHDKYGRELSPLPYRAYYSLSPSAGGMMGGMGGMAGMGAAAGLNSRRGGGGSGAAGNVAENTIGGRAGNSGRPGRLQKAKVNRP